MTWDTMITEVKEFKHFLTEKKEIIGFTIAGMTYDGDGNCQDGNGTDMQIVFKNKDEYKKFVEQLKFMEKSKL
jgi:hypothetical protein